MIRQMKWWDLEQVQAIEDEVFGATAWSPESFWSELAREDRYYVVAEDGGIVGYAGAWLVPPEADVQTVAVAPQARGRGLGEQLLGHLIAHARDRGCRRLQLEVKAGNESAIGLYRRLGFVKIRVRERYYPDFTDAHVMGLEL